MHTHSLLFFRRSSASLPQSYLARNWNPTSLLTLLLAGTALSFCRAQQIPQAAMALKASVVVAADPSWARHEDPRGFAISAPADWRIHVTSDGTITARSASGSDFVAVRPFVLPETQASAQWLRGAPQRLASLFPQARIDRLQPCGSYPDQSIASMSFRLGGQPARATLLCAIEGHAGTLYAIAAPSAAFERSKAQLTRILGTLRFTQPTGSAEGAKSPVRLSYVEWRDPVEGAFTTEVPKGWKALGGLVRRNALDPRETATILSPDQSILLQFGDATVPGFILPSAALAAARIYEGMRYTTGPVTYVVQRFRDGAYFANSWLRSKVTAPYGNLRIMQSKDRPDMAEPLEALLNRAGGGLFRYRVSVGEVPFTCEKNGQPLDGVCFGVDVLQSSGAFNIWGGFPVGYVAPPGKTAEAYAALKHMIETWRTDPRWVAQQSAIAVRVAKICTDASHQISKTINDVYEHRTKAQETASRHWDDYILGVTDVKDPTTGKTYQVAGGHNYFWLQNGEVKSGNNPPPDVDTNRLKAY